MNSKTCPDQASLRLWLLGKTSGPTADQLEAHLLRCDDCSATADTISANDKLTAAIQSPDVVHGDEDVLAEAIERAKRLRSEAETGETDETLIASNLRKDEPADRPRLDEDIDFLAPPEQPDEIGRLGDYRVLDVLGVGGMGVVFRAEDPKLDRQIALKAMKPALAASRSAKDRFVREAKATAAIEHDNIVSIYQVGEDRNVPFIAMPFLRGESLQKRLERETQLDQRDVARIGREVAAGLSAAHASGLIHRDIKPDNIWLEGKAGRVKIVDFGLARTATDDSGLTQTGMVLGTPKYMAPEQAKGELVDHRCDLFSLGSVLFHLASGRAPFDGGNLTAILIAVSQADFPAIEEVCKNLHPDLAKLITRLLSKEREDRPQSAAEVAETLAAIEKTLEEAEQQQVAETRVLDKSQVAGMEPEPRLKSRAPIFFAGSVVAIALAVFGWLYYAGLIFQVETKEGTLVVKVTGDDFATSVQGRQVTIRNTETAETFTIDLKSPPERQPLKPGEYTFELTTDSGLNVATDRFTIRGGQDQVVEVSWVPSAPRLATSSVVQPPSEQEGSTAAVADDRSGSMAHNDALSFDGKDDYVEIPTLSLDAGQVTVEAVVEVASVPPSRKLVSIVSDEGGALFLSVNSQSGFSFLLSRNRQLAGNQLANAFTVDQRVHVRGIFDGKDLLLTANGKRTEHPFEDFRGSRGHLFVGRNPNLPTWFHGRIYELRISKVARYRNQADINAPLENDEETLALYHFEMGSGDTLVDSSGNGHHGKIHGATWVYGTGSSPLVAPLD